MSGRRMKCLLGAAAIFLLLVLRVHAQGMQPVVAIHDSELTRALENMSASGATPSGAGTSGNQWWPTNWHYFVMPESMKEALRSDGTAYTVVGDSNITSGVLLTNGQPRFPICISLAAEAMRDDEIAPLTNYVAAGGVLFIGSSSFTRNTNGTTRGDFAIANQMGIHMAKPGLTNWSFNNYFTKATDHRLVNHIPSGDLIWRMAGSADEIPWGSTSPHPASGIPLPHPAWQVNASNATVIAYAENYPTLLVNQYGKGYFIYYAPMQPLIGHSGWAPGMYSYVMFRRAIEWAFELAKAPLPKVSPWPYPYDAAFMVRHDLEDFDYEVAGIKDSAQVEFNNGAKGDYYFCTGTLREDMAGSYNTNTVVNDLRTAITSYGATISTHNGGLKNPNYSFAHSSYDYWHWGLDEALNASPAGYANGKAYAFASLSNSFIDIEKWLPGLMTNGMRVWVAPYFNSTRENSLDVQAQLGLKVVGEQKLSIFPSWVLSTTTPNKRYSYVSQPVSDWYIDGSIAQSLEWHSTNTTMRAVVDTYYNLGGLINLYSHTLANGLGQAGDLMPEYVTYGMNTNLHPRLWSANAIGVYQWWQQRSNVLITASYSTNGAQSSISLGVKNSVNTNTTVEVVIPVQFSQLQVFANNSPANANTYRTNGQVLKVRVGTTVTNVTVSYTPCTLAPATVVFSQNFDGVSAPNLPSGWTTSTSGAQSAWVTQSSVRDSAPNAASTGDAASPGVSSLTSPVINLPDGQSQIAFKNYYNTEAGYDGGVLEIKIGGGSFNEIISAGGSFITGGYSDSLSPTTGNPLAGQQAWSGDSGGFINTLITIPSAASGQSVQFRWRCGSDNGNGGVGWRVDSVSVTNQAWVCTGNNPPVLQPRPDQTIAELQSLIVTNTATDPDGPTNVLSYALIGAPAGAAISTNGVITWTPDESQGPNSYTFTTLVTDGGNPPLSSFNSFVVTVTESNLPPSLPSPANRTIVETTTMIVTNTATDTDLPANNLTYTLTATNAAGLVTNASISASGVITWTPSEAQGPSTNGFVTVVNDNASPPLTATNFFRVVVSESNMPPVFVSTPTNRTMPSLVPLTVTNAATDADLPANQLSYALLNPPLGMTINASTGVITWTPSGAQDPSTNTIITVVTDSNPLAVNSQQLSATNSFVVIVSSLPQIIFNSSTLLAESCIATNNAIDPGETVTVNISLKNTGTGNTTDLVARLLETNGVTAPGAAQSYGVMVAGGSAVSRAFTFTAGGTCGGTISATLQLQDGVFNRGTVTIPFSMGSTGQVYVQNFDSVSVPALPSGWTTSSSGAESNWVTQTTIRDTVPNAAFCPDVGNIGLSELVSPAINAPLGQSKLTFRNNYDFETGAGNDGYDGGVLEIKIGTNAFTDILTAGGSFASGGYNSVINSTFSNPLGGRQAWSGTSGSFINTSVNLPASAAGQAVQFRWRVGTDNGNNLTGWRIDTISVTGLVCCANSGPILPGQTNRTIAESTPLTVTNTATGIAPLSYSLVGNPVGSQINSNGIITWTPGESQGPSTNTFTTLVTDSGAPPITTSNSFTVVVTEVNSAPILTVPANQTINESSPLSVTATATDSDVPTNTLTFSLGARPTGMSIGATSGQITWTPDETQGPSTNTVWVIVTDSGSPALSVSNSFVVTVREINTAPVLTVPANQTINESTPLSVTATATDADVPTNTLAFSLGAHPAGMSIGASSGQITWTPDETQGPGTNTVWVIVTDNGSPALSVSNSFVVVVREVNSAPVLAVPANQTINESTLLSVTATATDSDIPTNTLSFSLGAHPAGMIIGAASGQIAWTPDETQGPGTNTVWVIVTDNGSPALSISNSFVVTVHEVNTAPVLTVPLDQTLDESTPLNVTATATDADVPTNTLTFSLGAHPVGMSIGPSTGQITWTPGEAQGPSTNTVWVVVVDNGSPALSVSNSFEVVVREVNTAPVLTVPTDRTIDETGSLNVTAAATDADISTNSLTFSFGAHPSGMNINGSSGQITWSPTESQGPSTNTVWVVVTDNGSPALSVSNSFVVTVQEVNTPPLLTVPDDQTVDEGVLLDVTATATDADVPTNSLTFSLGDHPAGMSINATNGQILWTSDESQGPATNTVWVIVTDDGVPSLSVSNSFAVVVREVNSPPVVNVPPDQTVDEGVLLNVAATTTDSDWPVNTLAFALGAHPAGMSINATNGQIAWTPDESQGSSTNTVWVIVTDDGTPSLSSSNSFQVVVREVNSAPLLSVPADQEVNEGSLLSVIATATDADIPANTLTFSLGDHPAGLSINATNGHITWTPDETQGPSTNTIWVLVTDDGTPALSSSNSFQIVVKELNSPPVLSNQADLTITELTTMVVTNTATDPDVPANTLAYTITVTNESGIVTNASISPDGVITWTPTEEQGPGTYSLTTVVTDDGNPPLSATNTFIVAVLEANQAPVLPILADLTIEVGAALAVTNAATDDDRPLNVLTYTLLSQEGPGPLSLVHAPSGALIDANGVITWTPGPAYAGTTNEFVTIVNDNGIPSLSATNKFVVTVNPSAPPPVIGSLRVTNGVATVTWSAQSGRTYKLQSVDGFGQTNWTQCGSSVVADGPSACATNAISGAEMRLYRVLLLP